MPTLILGILPLIPSIIAAAQELLASGTLTPAEETAILASLEQANTALQKS